MMLGKIRSEGRMCVRLTYERMYRYVRFANEFSTEGNDEGILSSFVFMTRGDEKAALVLTISYAYGILLITRCSRNYETEIIYFIPLLRQAMWEL